MKISKTRLKQIIKEELTRKDKADIKKIVQDELGKLLKKKETKQEMSEIVKKIMKKLYKDLSIEHSYIIDRIKIQCYNVMRIGDLVTLKDIFPIWLLSIGLDKGDYGIVVDIDEHEKKIEIYWFTIHKSYVMDIRVIKKL